MQSDRDHLERCVDLAKQALEAGDEPFGSVLTDRWGTSIAEDRNRSVTVDPTWHPELALVRRAVELVPPPERAATTVFTSGEHCPMCAAAHAWAGLGRIVYIHSSEQLDMWRHETDPHAPPVRNLSIHQVAPFVMTEGPVDALLPQMQELHQRFAVRRIS